MRDELERAWIDRAVIEPFVEFGLWSGLRGELDELPGELSVRRSFDDAPRAGAAHSAVPDELDRHSCLPQFGRPAVPDRHHVDLAIADQLLRLIALPPPHLAVPLDLVELRERTLEVQRI